MWNREMDNHGRFGLDAVARAVKTINLSKNYLYIISPPQSTKM